MSIPIIIGVTGHRDLRRQDIPALRKAVHIELKKLKTAYSHSEFVMLNSLAAGADTLCAEEALKLGISLVCPLPMSKEEYSKDFSDEELTVFENLLCNADNVFVAPYTEPEEDSRDYLYRQAGIYIAVHSHVLLALWDGSSSKPDGCGTAETVEFMLNGSYNDGNKHFRAVNDSAVIHIVTPRQGLQKDIIISSKLIEKKPGSLDEILRMTDDFNKDTEAVSDCSSEENTLLPNDHFKDNLLLNRLSRLFVIADKLSIRFQTHYMKAMKLFSVFGFLLVLFFLLYDEMESDLFLLFYGLLIVVYMAAFIVFKRNNTHEKYLQYRLLSETARVQFYLIASGLIENIGNEFTWTQKQESTWIKESMSALLIGREEKKEVSDELIKTHWIDGQLAYHKKAFLRDSRRHKINERTAMWMLAASVALFVIVFIFEFFIKSAVNYELFKNPLPAVFLHHPNQAFTVRSLVKILLGGISAVTVFLANYYGKLSFERKSADHEKMASLYESAKAKFENGQTDLKQLFLELAREEIIETGNWMSYCRENSPSFNV